MKKTYSQTFNELYKELFSEWTRRNRREVKRLSESIREKLENGKKLTKDENDLYYKVQMWFERASFTQEDIDEQNLSISGLLKQISDNFYLATSFSKDAAKQNISEAAQKKHMSQLGYQIEKLSSSGKNSLRFCSQNKTLVSEKVEGGTSRSFDYIKEYGETVEYFLGKVCWGQGGHQNGVKNEIVRFLKSANEFLENNPDSNMVFTALVDGDAITEENVKEYRQYTDSKVRFFNSDEYVPFS
jgi:hypothetical protein